MDLTNILQWFFRIITAVFIYYAVHILCDYMGMPVPRDIIIEVLLVIISLLGGYFAFDE